MEEESNRKYAGKAKYISEKYQFKKFEDYSKFQFIALIKELVSELKSKEKIIATNERDIEKMAKDIVSYKKKLQVFYNDDDGIEKFVGYNNEWTYIDKICFVIERYGKPITGKKIVELILKIEPQLAEKIADPYNSITKAIYVGIKLERIRKHNKTGNNGYNYALNNFLRS
jgi:hypothetical protein